MTSRESAARARQGKQAPLRTRLVGRLTRPGSLRDVQLPVGTGRSFGSVLRGADALTGASSILKGLAGATTGMHTVRSPRDLVGREAGAAAALAGVSPTPGGQAVALGPRIVKLRNVLGLPKGGAGIREAREFNELADMPMLPLTKDIRELLTKVLPDASTGVRKGGAHRVDARSKFGEFVQDRTAIIQDPETGTMFAAPGALHADLIDYVKRHHPEFDRGPRGFMQHEVYGPTPAYVRGGDPIPARVMFGDITGHAGFGERIKDTPAATISRARLIQNLQQMGVVGDVAEQKRRRAAMLKSKRK